MENIMMEHTTDRLFWTLTSIIIGALLLTIGIKAFPQMTNSTLQTFSGVTKQADTATNTASDAVNQVLNGYTGTSTGTNSGNNTATQQPTDPYAQAKANAVEASTLGLTAVDNGDGTASITYISPSNATNLVIPSYVKVNGNLLKVTTLGSNGATGNITKQADAVQSINIPNTVTTIYGMAFAFENIQSLTIPNSVTMIGSSAFKWNNITSVTVPNSVTSLATDAFDTSVTITRS